jgi:cytochrome P450
MDVFLYVEAVSIISAHSTLPDLSRCTKLSRVLAVINETLRLFPPVSRRFSRLIRIL